MEKPWYHKLLSAPPQSHPHPADYENAEVQFHMGLKFANGEGAAPDYEQAAAWYGKAAAQSHPLAQFNLGTMCAKGQGMAADGAQALTWFTRAATLGDAGAQFHLAKSRHRASFTESPGAACESRIEAYKWYHLAAAQGYAGSVAAGSTLVLNMSHDEVASGEQRAAEFERAQPRPAQD